MFDVDTCVSFITNQAAKKLADAFNNRLVPKGITRVQWIALFYLGKFEKINQKRLGELMNIKDSTVARLIDRMENEGFLRRTKDPEDRRHTLLKLTEKGEHYREKMLGEGEEMSKIYAKDISDEEIEVFKKVLNKMVSNIE